MTDATYIMSSLNLIRIFNIINNINLISIIDVFFASKYKITIFNTLKINKKIITIKFWFVVTLQSKLSTYSIFFLILLNYPIL